MIGNKPRLSTGFKVSNIRVFSLSKKIFECHIKKSIKTLIQASICPNCSTSNYGYYIIDVSITDIFCLDCGKLIDSVRRGDEKKHYSWARELKALG